MYWMYALAAICGVCTVVGAVGAKGGKVDSNMPTWGKVLAKVGLWLFVPVLVVAWFIGDASPLMTGTGLYEDAFWLQLTDAMKTVARKEGMTGVVFSGERHDMGNKFGMLKANIDVGLTHPETKDELKAYIKKLAEEI